MKEHLVLTEGGGEKVSDLTLARTPDGWKVEEVRSGKGLRSIGVPYLGPDEAEAERIFAARLRERVVQGYERRGDPPVAIGRQSGQVAWLPTDLDEAELPAMLADPAWILQEKEDGVHVIGYCLPSGVVTTNRKGDPYELPAVLKGALTKLPMGYVVDGEFLQVAKRLKLFDTLHTDRADLRQEPYERRWRATLAAVRRMRSPWVAAVRSAVGERDKKALLAKLREEQAEGAIFKRLDAPYTAGAPARGGTMRRLKFRERADVICVRRRGDTKESFEMFVMHEGQPVSCGAVSARRVDASGRTFYSQLKPGDRRVIEVSYLYASGGYRLVQPTLERFRDDKGIAECTRDQLKVGKRFLTDRAG